MTRPLAAAVAAVLLGVPVGCQSGGNFSILGYSTKPPYDPNIRSVYIPAFKIVPFHSGPYRGFEADITQAIVDELNRRRSPIRVVSDPARADTELVGTVTYLNKVILNTNLLNLPREYDVVVTVEVVWRDLRSGRILTGTRGPGVLPPERPFDPSLPPPPAPPPDRDPVRGVTVTGYGKVLPELGESTTTGMQKAAQDLARSIVNMMEAPW